MLFNGFGGNTNSNNKRPMLDDTFRNQLQYNLRRRLSTESDWKEKVTAKCEQLIDKHGVENIDLDKLVKEVTPFARHAIPDDIKRWTFAQIQQHLEKS